MWPIKLYFMYVCVYIYMHTDSISVVSRLTNWKPSTLLSLLNTCL